MKKYTEILRSIREDRELSQIAIAKIIGTSQQQYSKYETGETELSARVLTILADYYGVSTDFLMGRTDCCEGVTAMNKRVTNDCTVGALVSDILSLSINGRKAVIEFIGFQKLKGKL